MMDILYCFKYDESTGYIEKLEITDYFIKTNLYTGRKTYCWNTPKINKCDTHYQLADTKLDRYVNNKVFTFNDNVKYVKRIILETMTDKYYKLETERLKVKDSVKTFLESFPEFDNEMEAV